MKSSITLILLSLFSVSSFSQMPKVTDYLHCNNSKRFDQLINRRIRKLYLIRVGSVWFAKVGKTKLPFLGFGRRRTKFKKGIEVFRGKIYEGPIYTHENGDRIKGLIVGLASDSFKLRAKSYYIPASNHFSELLKGEASNSKNSSPVYCSFVENFDQKIKRSLEEDQRAMRELLSFVNRK